MYKPDQTFRALRNSIYALLLLGVSCTKGDKVPSYVVVSSPSLQTSTFPIDEGSNSQSITHAWVFVNDQTYGPWQLPARVPVLQQGEVEIKIVAGIERNGSSTDIKQYPFYDTYVQSATLNPGDQLFIEPEFKYFSGLEFWQDDFDSGNLFTVASNSDTLIATSGAMTFEGNNSGAIYLGPDDLFFEAQTEQDFIVPLSDPTYLELNYASDQTILVGAYVDGPLGVQRIPHVFISPSVQEDGTIPWKKIYIDMSDVWQSPLVSDRELFFAITKDSSPNGVVYLDNVKIIHRDI